MLIENHTDKDCRFSWVDNGDCCCNCIHRYLLVIDNFPIGFVCRLQFEDSDTEVLNDLKWSGHGLCEMHVRTPKNN